MKKTVVSLAVASALVMGMSALLSAKVPPPPVNQNPATIYDTKFGTFTVADCKGCHGTDAALVTLHHNLINTTTPAVSCYNSSGTLPATLATGCHVLVPAVGGGYTFQDFRNCLNCHTGQSPHHMSTWAAAQDCQHCHGSVIDNPKDGHYIPTYAINTDSTTGGVTPAPKGRSVPDPANPGKTIIVQGCAACHQADATATPQIYGNNDLHHGTNIGSFLQPGGVGSCNWCHDANTTIRGCEQCHGVKSLHNIQFDSTNANNLGTIKPGNEDLGYGHIGNNWDCQGCHSSWNGTATGDTQIIAPAVSSLNTPVITAGTTNQLIISGGGFTNDDNNGNAYTPVVTLTAANGAKTTYTPFSFTNTEVKINLPALVAGIYEVRVDKSGTFSNLKKLVVAPKQLVKSSLLSGTTLTITGSGFGTAPSGASKALMGVFVGTTQARIVLWSDTRVVASSPAFAAGKTATIKTLFGPLNSTISAAVKKVQ